MPITAGLTDPLDAFLRSRGGGGRPVPLVATAVEVEVAGGIAIVSTRRVFRNAEDASLEAVLTFPVPIAATLFALEARIDDRLIVATAQARGAARETYEAAVADGRTAVLHEEVLRGVHMLSVAPLAPEAEIAVTARWVAPLAMIGGTGQLRIPMTVGDIYGMSGLPETDDLLIGGAPGEAELAIRCEDGTVEVLGIPLEDGRGRAPLDAPIDFVVRGLAPRALRGVTAGGREVQLTVSPCEEQAEPLDLAILVDRSGSMESLASGHFGPATKHAAALAALAGAAPSLGERDRIDLWEFDHGLNRVGSTSGAGLMRDRFRALVARLQEPGGGTEIGAALEGAMAGSRARDILVITDGKSHALDIDRLARSGRRISALLVGEDSLEANVGHLAALTGGDLFMAMEADMAPALGAALAGLRVPGRAPVEAEDGGWLRTIRRGARITVEWGPSAPQDAPGLVARGVAALAASLQMTMLHEAEAARLAEREGLVTHLTSLVLVDHAGEVVDGIPVMRKVALPTPRTALEPFSSQFRAAPGDWDASIPTDSLSFLAERIQAVDFRALRKFSDGPRVRRLRSLLPADDPACRTSADASANPPRSANPRLRLQTGWQRFLDLARRIDWNEEGPRLAAGDISRIEAEVIKSLLRQAARRDIVAAAGRLDLDPLLLVIALLAREAASGSRAAARVERTILRGLDPHLCEEVKTALDLVYEQPPQPNSEPAPRAPRRS